MKVGIDLRALQTGHKFRGIGEVTKQVTNRVIALGKEDGCEFVFYEYDDDDPKALLDLPDGLQYTVQRLGLMPENPKNVRTKQQKVKDNLRLLYGAPIVDTAKVDVYLQFDYAFGVPKDTRTVLVMHDLIPIIFWDKYFESPMVPLRNRAARTTLRTIYANYKYMRILKRSLYNAYRIVAVSDSTKRDLIRYFNVRDDKIDVALLGVDMQPAKTNETGSATTLPTKPYLLFVGAGDARRRVDDLVAAYNNLKADGHDIQLVLVGENFKKPEMIPNTAVRNEVLHSSYKDDILTLGYVDDETKQRLFRGALAYVYPTKYEGFGIPVLEAMLMDCPVITYKNSSIPEVGGRYAIYAKNWLDIQRKTEELIAWEPAKRAEVVRRAHKHADLFTWDKTAASIYDDIKASVTK